MSWIDWLISSSVLLAVATGAWLLLKKPLQEVISQSITSKVLFIFDRQLEELREQIGIRDRKLVAQLDAEKMEVEAIRSGALSSLASRNAVLIEKRIEAAQTLWNTVIELRKLIPVCQLMQVIKFEVAAERAKTDPRVKEMFEQLSKIYDIKPPIGANGESCRLFVSSRAFTYFECYRLILVDAAMKMHTIRCGVGKDMYNAGSVSEIIKQKLPEFSTAIDSSRRFGLSFLISPLEEGILGELKQTIGGGVDDKETVVKAAEIVNLSVQMKQVPNSPELADFIAQVPLELKRSPEPS
jgi:hypothetical protein